MSELGRVPEGTCFPDAWRFILDQGMDWDGFLVHGTVMVKDKPIKHCWVDAGKGYIWEPQTKRLYTQDEFEELFNPAGEKRYRSVDAVRLAARTKHYGPWEEV